MAVHHGARPQGNIPFRDAWFSKHDTTLRTDGIPEVELNFRESTGDRTVDWGDGTVEIRNEAFPTHTYADHGTYTVVCYGGVTTRMGRGPRFNDWSPGWAFTLTAVYSWGNFEWTDLEGAFLNLGDRLTKLPPYLPSTVTDIRGCFRGSTPPVDIEKWDVSNVTVFRFFSWFGGGSFSPPAPDLTNWDTSNAVDMFAMLGGTNFNQDISGWDVSNVTGMRAMFRSNGAFNQDISGWDVSNVDNMQFMFSPAGSFDQDLGAWPLRTAGLAMDNMFDDSGMSTENYSRTLIGWANYVSENNGNPANVVLGASGVTYNNTAYTTGNTYNDAVSARAYLTSTAGWTITDDGEV